MLRMKTTMAMHLKTNENNASATHNALNQLYSGKYDYLSVCLFRKISF